MYGQVSPDDAGVVRPVEKPTTFMTNSPAMERFLNKRCTLAHQHTQLFGKWRTEGAQVYPRGLVDAIVSGIKLQKEWDAAGRFQIGFIHSAEAASEEIGPIPLKKIMITCLSLDVKLGTTLQDYPSTQGELPRPDRKKCNVTDR